MDRVKTVFAIIEPELDAIMDAIQGSGLSLLDMRGVIDEMTAYALAVGVALTDDINGVPLDHDPDMSAVKAYVEHVLRCIDDSPGAA